jgi:fatty-acyl-CoA synthase
VPPSATFPRVANGESRTLADVLLARAHAEPNRPAFADERERVTYGELAERAGRRAAGLRASGVRRGDRVAIVMSAGVALVEVFWAAQLLGAPPCLLNPALPEALAARRIAMLAPRLIVDDLSARRLSGGGERLICAVGEIDPGAIAYLQLTSGSTGEPRASLLSHRSVLAYLRGCRTATILGREDVFISWVPPWHDLGLVRFVISPVFFGARCRIIQPAVRTIPQWMRAISELGGTYSAAPDFALRLAVRMVGPASVDLSRLRCLKCGGEPIRASTLTSFGERFGCVEALTPGYGLGEAVLAVSGHLPGEALAIDSRGNVSCGPANPGLELRAGSSLQRPGEILVRGPTLFSGYLGDPQETARALRDGWLHTGDLGYLDAAGRLFVLGRRAGMIKRAGAVVAPRELEEAAQRVPGVRIAAAVGVGGGDREETVVVAVERDRRARCADDELAAAVSRAVLGEVGFAPGRVQVMARGQIPLSENGKLRYAELRARLEAPG